MDVEAANLVINDNIIDNIKLVAGWMCHRTQYGGVRLMCCGGKAKIVIAH